MNPWFRMYVEVLDDPKIQRLPCDLFKSWVNVLCLASVYDGKLPPLHDIAFRLRVSEAKTTAILQQLRDAGLLDGETELTPHNWANRQFTSDGSKERMRRLRKRKRDGTSDVTGDVTIPVTVTPVVTGPEQSRTDQNRAEGEAPKSPSEKPPEKPAKPKPVKSQELKHPFGELGNVKLSQIEQGKLKALLNGKFEHYVARLDYWGAENPADFAKKKSHYATIRNWVNRDVADGKLQLHGPGIATVLHEFPEPTAELKTQWEFVGAKVAARMGVETNPESAETNIRAAKLYEARDGLFKFSVPNESVAVWWRSYAAGILAAIRDVIPEAKGLEVFPVELRRPARKVVL